MKPAPQNLQQNLTIDSIEILGYQINVFPANQTQVVVVYASGYQDGEGNFVPVNRHQKPIQGEGAQRFNEALGTLNALAFEEIEKPE